MRVEVKSSLSCEGAPRTAQTWVPPAGQPRAASEAEVPDFSTAGCCQPQKQLTQHTKRCSPPVLIPLGLLCRLHVQGAAGMNPESFPCRDVPPPGISPRSLQSPYPPAPCVLPWGCNMPGVWGAAWELLTLASSCAWVRFSGPSSRLPCGWIQISWRGHLGSAQDHGSAALPCSVFSKPRPKTHSAAQRGPPPPGDPPLYQSQGDENPLEVSRRVGAQVVLQALVVGCGQGGQLSPAPRLRIHRPPSHRTGLRARRSPCPSVLPALPPAPYPAGTPR